MAQRKTVKSTKKSTPAVKTDPKPKTPTQAALEVTWLLKGNLKNARIAYIRIGILLARVRDEKLYTALKHPDIESYAEARLQLGRSSLYKYLQVHDWMVEFHPKWLEPKPEGFIPELADAGDLIWIENELAKKDLKPATRTTLEGLQKKAMEGQLREGDLKPHLQRQNTAAAGLKSYLSKLRLLRRRAAELASMPPEVISYLDKAIEILNNDHTTASSGQASGGARSGSGAKNSVVNG
ncbi:MAG: hypothetical protein WCI03_04885 [bacterium]|jgi:hypothetical protein